MSRLTCEFSKPIGVFDDIPNCEFKFLRELSRSVEKLRPIELVEGRTRSLKKHISEFVSEIAADNNLELSDSFSLCDDSYPDSPHANLRLDYLFECRSDETGRHVFGLEICLDNRIALGTNVLKAKALDRIHPSSDTIMFVLERTLLDSGGWDPAYADSEIYERDISHFYSKLISEQLTLFSVGLRR